MTVSDKMKFVFEDREYDFKESWSTRDAIFLKKESGATITTVMDYLNRRDPETVQAVVFLHKRANQEVVRFEDLMDANIASFRWILPNTEQCKTCDGRGMVLVASPELEEETSEEAADPTPPGKTRKGGTSKTV
jgi:hypothetical protein